MHDHALHLFQANIAGGLANDLKLFERTPFQQMQQGWAMKQKRIHVKFSEKQQTI